MKVLVTGVTGFVGGFLLRQLAAIKRDRSFAAIATARRPDFAAEATQWADEYLAADLSEHCSEIAADICIHAAGLADDRSSSADLQRANVDGTKNLLEALRDCRLFVYISSASVYGLKDGSMVPRSSEV